VLRAALGLSFIAWCVETRGLHSDQVVFRRVHYHRSGQHLPSGPGLMRCESVFRDSCKGSQAVTTDADGDPTKKQKKKEKKTKRSQTQERSRRSQPAPAGMLLHSQGCSSRPVVLCACSTAVSDLTRIQTRLTLRYTTCTRQVVFRRACTIVLSNTCHPSGPSRWRACFETCEMAQAR
jgi:hypothetical protein